VKGNKAVIWLDNKRPKQAVVSWFCPEPTCPLSLYLLPLRFNQIVYLFLHNYGALGDLFYVLRQVIADLFQISRDKGGVM
jgi:hypothetical protein